MRQNPTWSKDQLAYKENVEASRLMGWMTFPDGYCFYLSPQWYEFTGHAPGQAEGYGWLDAIHVEDRVRTCDAYFSATNTRSSYGVEYRIMTRHNKAVQALAKGCPSFTESGEFNGFLGLTNPVIGIVDALTAADESGRAMERPRILSRREREVLSGVAAGFTDEHIARQLGISARTVAAHAQKAIQRIGASNRAHACVAALQLSEIDFPQPVSI